MACDRRPWVPGLTRRAGVALLSGAVAIAIGPLAAPAVAATLKAAKASHPAAMVGDWLGPFPGPAGQCSPEYSEWFFRASGSYTFTWNSDRCGGATSYGKYATSGDLLTLHQQSTPNCGTCVQRQTIEVTFHFVLGHLRLCDYPSGSCYTYSRQN